MCESYGTTSRPAQCSMQCLKSCWLSPSSPCLQDCATDSNTVLFLVLLPFFGRLLVDYVLDAVFGATWRKCCLKRGPEFRTCLDRPFVQLEIRAAREHAKKVITVFDEDGRRQGYFDYGLASAKYGGTEWEFLLNIDSVTYRRDRFEACAMVDRILAKAQTQPAAAQSELELEPEPEPAAAPPLNEPGHWDFFLSHGRAAAGDQVKMLCLLLRGRQDRLVRQ